MFLGIDLDFPLMPNGVKWSRVGTCTNLIGSYGMIAYSRFRVEQVSLSARLPLKQQPQIFYRTLTTAAKDSMQFTRQLANLNLELLSSAVVYCAYLYQFSKLQPRVHNAFDNIPWCKSDQILEGEILIFESHAFKSSWNRWKFHESTQKINPWSVITRYHIRLQPDKKPQLCPCHRFGYFSKHAYSHNQREADEFVVYLTFFK